ncbi:MAG: hypothetical protein KME67_03890 [Candidatus Thiodiazotropha sp. (ex Codakia orbicularis)]|nr:hypothetical protein [Candidatus Thiodiazotropha sp. (ex Codakia orbicularis)]
MLTAIGAGVASGLSSTLATVAALRVHISYLRTNVEKNEAAIKRAHERITKLSDVVHRCRITIQKLHPGADV